MQVVAVLNPIAGEKMQVDLEDRIASLQGELDKAHSQVLQALLLTCMTHKYSTEPGSRLPPPWHRALESL